MEPGTLTIVIFALLLLFLALGIPVAFSLFAVSMILALFLSGTKLLFVSYIASFSYMTKELLIALPLFIFMAAILEFSGVIANMYNMAYKWFGPFRGGLAIGTLIIAALIDAMSGLGATATVTLGVLALPEMLRRGYHRDIALGCIPAGGSLGPVIPPSVIMILLGSLTSISIGRLFISGLLPGLLITGLWCVFVAVYALIKPSVAPALPPDARASWGEKFKSLRQLVMPIVLILVVLGAIYRGIATPSEVGGIGAVGAMLCAAVNRKLNWRDMRKAIILTGKITGLCMWLLLGGASFANILQTSGVSVFIRDTMLGISPNPMVIFIMQQIVGIVLGCFVDAGANLMITVPIFWPMILALPSIDPVWWGCVYTLTLCVGYITPPFGMNLFYLKGVAPKEFNVTLGEIYRAAIPFSLVFFVGIALCIAFPVIVTYLPNLMMGK